MRLFVVAWREAPVAVALTAAGRRIGLETVVLMPLEAARRAGQDDLGPRVPRREASLDGVEPGIAKLRGIRARGSPCSTAPRRSSPATTSW